jgi:hypothetical protein
MPNQIPRQQFDAREEGKGPESLKRPVLPLPDVPASQSASDALAVPFKEGPESATSPSDGSKTEL